MNTAVFAFGRMNPPTIGHKKLVDKVSSIPGDHFVFLSHASGNKTQKPGTKQYENKDPLPFSDKLAFVDVSFPTVTVGHESVKTVMDAMKKLQADGYTDVVMVAGSDRVDDFTELLNKYQGQEYDFNTIEVVSAGERDPDAEGADGMSASKMRAAVRSGDFESFKQGAASPQIAKPMFDMLTKILKQNPMPGDAFNEEVLEMVTKKQIDDLEDQNHHGEVATLLAKHFGTDKEQKLVAKINALHSKRGNIEHEEQITRDKIIKKYYAKVTEMEEGLSKQDSLMGVKDPVISISDKNGKPVDRLKMSDAAKKYKFNMATIRPQFQHQDKVQHGQFTLSAPISGQPMEAETKKNCGCGQTPCVTYGDQEDIKEATPTSEYDYDIKKFFAKVQELEDENQHGEVAEMLTQLYGTSSELMIIRGINGIHANQGSIDPEEQKLRDKISTKYYYQAQKEAGAESLGEAVNVNKIHKAVDDGNSMDVIVGMFADKRTTNTDEIRKIVKDYMFKKRMNKTESTVNELIISKPKKKSKEDGEYEIDPNFPNLKTKKKPSHFDKRKALARMVPRMQNILSNVGEMDLTREQLHGVLNKAAKLMIEIEIAQKNDIVENLHSLNTDDVMQSEVLVKGVGRYSVEGLMKNISEKLQDLSNESNSMEPFNYKNIKSKLDSGIVNVMLDSLIQAYDDLENARRKGGAASRSIPKNIFDDVMLQELEITQGTALKVLDNVANRSDKKPFPVRMKDGTVIDVSPALANEIISMYDAGGDVMQKKIMSLLSTGEGFRELINAAKKKNRTLR